MRMRCFMARAEGAREKVLGALPRNPARGTPPETPGRCGNAGRWTPVENSPLALRADHSSTSSFPPVAHRPWKSQKARFPHSHSADEFLTIARGNRSARASSETFKNFRKEVLARRSLRSRLQAHSSMRKCSLKSCLTQVWETAAVEFHGK